MSKDVSLDIRNKIISAITEALGGVEGMDPASVSVILERPAEMVNGDFSTNVAMACAKKLKTSPLSLAVTLVQKLSEKIKAGELEGVAKVEAAGAGFINFYMSPVAVRAGVSYALENGFGKNSTLAGKKIAYEYTDPNPFKTFHIGHLMSNTIGESLSRLSEYSGAEVKRFCYQGDVGRHVALTIYGLRFMPEGTFPAESASLSDKVAYFGKAYALGATKFKKAEDESKKETTEEVMGKDGKMEKKPKTILEPTAEFTEISGHVRDINKKVYDKSNEEINKLYAKGKEWSLESFEEIYAILGTKFDRYFFESDMVADGLVLVNENTAPSGKSIFEKSNDAIIFPGEKYGLHTRVFINRDNLPTYEAKELGLAKQKYAVYSYDLGITITANEQDDYFKVTKKAIELLMPEVGPKMHHISHGMFRLPTGKMGSRIGNVVSGESLVNDMIALANEKMTEREMTDEQKKKTAEQVAVAAIKYTVLRQATGKDIIFDAEKSLSFEGDSGPYLQYSCVRARSVLEKAKKEEIAAKVETEDENPAIGIAGSLTWAGGKIERLISLFPEKVAQASADNSPHTVATYLMELAMSFNSFYASTQIVGADDKLSHYKVALVTAFSEIMESGLNVLGIAVPTKM